MFQFVYISTLARSIQPDPTADILTVSRRNNIAKAVSGVLLHRRRRFLQVLEGERSDVLATVERIRRDSRHLAIVALSEREVAVREFGGWTMASDREMPADQVLEVIDRLTRNANPNLRAQFLSYAALDLAA